MTIQKKHIKPLLRSGYLPQSEAEEKMKKFGYSYDKELSNMDTKVFVSPDGVPTIVHRGTKNMRDVFDDGMLAIGLGEYGFRYKNAKRVTDKAANKYLQPVDTVSHSYGGWLGEHSNAKGEIVTYNKAVGLGDVFRKNADNQTDIRTTGDLVSLLAHTQTGGSLNVIQNNHLLENFLTAHEINNII